MIGCCVAVPRSHWSAVPTALFIYISQLLRDSFSVPFLLPIIPCFDASKLVQNVDFIQRYLLVKVINQYKPGCCLWARCCRGLQREIHQEQMTPAAAARGPGPGSPSHHKYLQISTHIYSYILISPHIYSYILISTHIYRYLGSVF